MKLLVMIENTLRELAARITLIILASISTLIILGTFAAIGTSETPEGIVFTMFSQPISPPTSPEDVSTAAGTMQAGLARGLFVGVMLFGVFATASAIPDMLEKGTIDLLLSKPIARWELLLGKYLGAVVVMVLNMVYFIGALFVVFGVKAGVWNIHFLLSAFTLSFVFAALFSITILLGVVFRNTAIPIIGSFLHLFVIDGILESRQMSLYLISENTVYRAIVDGAYYILPQISAMQESVTRQIMNQPMSWEPFGQSLLSAALFFGGASWIFTKRDF